MSKSFKTVSRLECQHCGKLFKTERHDCKFDPEKRNCLTCRHNHGQRMGETGNPWNPEGSSNFFDCDLGDKTAGMNDLDAITSCDWNLQCECWEIVEGLDKARNIREASANHLRRLNKEEWGKHQEEMKSQGNDLLDLIE